MSAPLTAIVVAWVLWAISWFIAAAVWAAPAAVRVGFRRERIYRAVTLVGSVLLLPPFRATKLWTPSDDVAWALVALGMLGFLFTWWARLYLGPLWSSTVTKKADHHVVDTGPYGLVRHPIYAGLIAAVLATAAIKGTAIAAAGALVMILGFFIKARLEERFLREQLGAEAYDSYRRRVPMLMPFGPVSH